MRSGKVEFTLRPVMRVIPVAHHAWCYDASVSRTTLRIEDDALKLAKGHAARHRLTIGQAVSELIRRAGERPLVTEERSGLRVVRLGRRSPKVASAIIDRLRDEIP